MIKMIKDKLRPFVHHIREDRVQKLALKAESHYQQLIEEICSSGRKRLRFASYVIFASTFGMDGVVREMIRNPDHWDVKIVIIPDISRGLEHAKNTYIKTKAYFIARYGADYVLDGWNPGSNDFYDLLAEFDIVYYANPYDHMVNEVHKIKYASTKNVLPVYISYGYDVGWYTTLSRLKGPELNLVWKLFADTTYTYHDYINHQIIKGKNVVLAGYSKMDNLVEYTIKKNNRKKILISPHHTVSFESLPLSNFLNYYDLIPRLPDLFPEIDFVFRPHPLLFTTLKNAGIWTSDDIERFLDSLTSRGVQYSTDGDYFALFSECDAIVNDCGSYTVEWLYTGKPGCFVYNSQLREDQLTTLMKKAISNYNIARSEEDIIAFIQNVSKTDLDDLDLTMKDWVTDNIALNYPNVCGFILKELDILA